MTRSKVALVRTSPSTVLSDIERLVELAGVKDALTSGVTTILKDNLSWHLPMPSANTTPWQLEGTILSLRRAGFTDLVGVENRTVVTKPFKGAVMNKLAPVYQKHGVDVLYNFEPSHMKWMEYKPKASMDVLHRVFPEGIHIPDYFIGKNIVHLPTVKCHIYTTTTGSMKNAFGGLLGTQRHYCHSVIHETLVDLLKIQKEIHPGLFAIMDGTTMGNGPGPRTLTPVQGDVMLASADQVAIDAVAASLMGFDPLRDLKFVRMAHEQGLGVGDPREIALVGDEVAPQAVKFAVGDNFASTVGDVMWFGPLKPLQHLCFRTPLVNAFIFASDYYHDRYWWPRHAIKVKQRWEKESPWGRLFAEY